MRAILDTNIIIHRENTKVTNYSIGQLYYWLDSLHYEKLIHPYTIEELRKYNNPQIQSLYDIKLSAYTRMNSIATQSTDFLSLLNDVPKTDNDQIDNQLLCEIFCQRADILITEDRKMLIKASRLGIADKVYTINSFISKSINENPNLIDYKALSVKKEFFGNIDINNHFFDTFRDSYDGFDTWFAGKCDEEAYICRNDKNDILGFLYLKTEGKHEYYGDITPVFPPKRRLKVGTFKVEASGFRLGERFIKIIFDNAIERNLDEIYLTLFMDRPELKALYELLIRWGFFKYGYKSKNGKTELVLVKSLRAFDNNKPVIYNFPCLDFNKNKMILPIFPKYHTSLFPDSRLRTESEIDFISNIPHRYALQKVYITWSFENNMSPGDLLLFYRTGETRPKKYSSVLTSIGVIDEVISKFIDENDFKNYCQNRSVFTDGELSDFWRNHRNNLKVIKFVFVKSLNKRLTLEYLWDHNIVSAPNGPRPFTKITSEQFNLILADSNTSLFM